MKRASAKPVPAPADEIMTVPTLVDYLRCSQTMIYNLLKTKQIPAFKLGSGPSSEWRFFRSAIDEWIEQREIALIAQQETIVPSVAKGRKSKVS
jgi:excisionase family DNA binding protein